MPTPAAVDCESDDLSQAEWTVHCADDAGGEDAPRWLGCPEPDLNRHGPKGQ
jgi:predicted phage-related endonuclease